MPIAVRYLLFLILGAGLALVAGQNLDLSSLRFTESSATAGSETIQPVAANALQAAQIAAGGLAPAIDNPLQQDQMASATATPGLPQAGTADTTPISAPSGQASEEKQDKELAPNSVAGIAESLQQVDPFIEDLAATNDNQATLENANNSSKNMNIDGKSNTDVPVVDLSTEAAPAQLAALIKKKKKSKSKKTETEVVDANAFELLGERVRSGTRKQLTWNASESLSGGSVPTPVLVVHGAEKGDVMCITAGVHGDELNGIETVRRIMHSTKPEKLKGTLVGVPIVNLQGFQRQTRYLPDRRDLNRFFPGHPKGSSASRIAHTFFDQVIRHCDSLVDLHTGSFHRTNLPQLRADLNNESVVELSQSFGSTVVLHSEGGVGTLRRAAVEAGIPAVTLEAGEPLRLQSDEVAHSVKGINTLLATRGMYKRRNIWGDSEAVYYSSQWVRADTGGILFSKIDLGKRVTTGELLGTVTDPVSNEREEIRATYSGRVIGMALNQFVMPGFATFHIGIETESMVDAMDEEVPTMLSHDVAFKPDMSVENIGPSPSMASAEPTEE